MVQYTIPSHIDTFHFKNISNLSLKQIDESDYHLFKSLIHTKSHHANTFVNIGYEAFENKIVFNVANIFDLTFYRSYCYQN